MECCLLKQHQIAIKFEICVDTAEKPVLYYSRSRGKRRLQQAEYPLSPAGVLRQLTGTQGS